MSGRLILGIETVTKIGSLAVVEDKKILGSVIIDTKLRHNAGFISSLNGLLKSLKIKISDIDVIAVDIGPGSFTGIRVGIASAIGLSQPDNKKLIGVCSLEVLCHQVKEKVKADILIPVIDAKSGMVYSAAYERDKDDLKVIKEPHLSTIDKLQKEKLSNSMLFGPNIDNIFPDAAMVALAGEGKKRKDSAQKKLAPLYIYDIEYRQKV